MRYSGQTWFRYRVHAGVEMGIKYKVVGVCKEVLEHGVQPASPGTGSIIPGGIVTTRTVGRGYMADRDGTGFQTF